MSCGKLQVHIGYADRVKRGGTRHTNWVRQSTRPLVRSLSSMPEQPISKGAVLENLIVRLTLANIAVSFFCQEYLSRNATNTALNQPGSRTQKLTREWGIPAPDVALSFSTIARRSLPTLSSAPHTQSSNDTKMNAWLACSASGVKAIVLQIRNRAACNFV